MWYPRRQGAAQAPFDNCYWVGNPQNRFNSTLKKRLPDIMAAMAPALPPDCYHGGAPPPLELVMTALVGCAFGALVPEAAATVAAAAAATAAETHGAPGASAAHKAAAGPGGGKAPGVVGMDADAGGVVPGEGGAAACSAPREQAAVTFGQGKAPKQQEQQGGRDEGSEQQELPGALGPRCEGPAAQEGAQQRGPPRQPPPPQQQEQQQQELLGHQFAQIPSDDNGDSEETAIAVLQGLAAACRKQRRLERERELRQRRRWEQEQEQRHREALLRQQQEGERQADVGLGKGVHPHVRTQPGCGLRDKEEQGPEDSAKHAPWQSNRERLPLLYSSRAHAAGLRGGPPHVHQAAGGAGGAAGADPFAARSTARGERKRERAHPEETAGSGDQDSPGKRLNAGGQRQAALSLAGKAQGCGEDDETAAQGGIGGPALVHLATQRPIHTAHPLVQLQQRLMQGPSLHERPGQLEPGLQGSLGSGAVQHPGLQVLGFPECGDALGAHAQGADRNQANAIRLLLAEAAAGLPVGWGLPPHGSLVARGSHSGGVLGGASGAAMGYAGAVQRRSALLEASAGGAGGSRVGHGGRVASSPWRAAACAERAQQAVAAAGENGKDGALRPHGVQAVPLWRARDSPAASGVEAARMGAQAGAFGAHGDADWAPGKGGANEGQRSGSCGGSGASPGACIGEGRPGERAASGALVRRRPVGRSAVDTQPGDTEPEPERAVGNSAVRAGASVDMYVPSARGNAAANKDKAPCRLLVGQNVVEVPWGRTPSKLGNARACSRRAPHRRIAMDRCTFLFLYSSTRHCHVSSAG